MRNIVSRGIAMKKIHIFIDKSFLIVFYHLLVYNEIL